MATTTTNNGIVLADIPQGFIFTSDAIQQNDGKLLVYGSYSLESINSDAVVLLRFNANGTLDSSFGNAGQVTIESNGVGFSKANNSISLQSDGSIIVLLDYYIYKGLNPDGTSIYDSFFSLIKLNASGVRDPFFGVAGTAKVDLYPDSASSNIGYDYPNSITVDANDNILVSGGSVNLQNSNNQFNANSFAANAIYRFLPNGQFDTSFNQDGILFNTSDLQHGLSQEGNFIHVYADKSFLITGIQTLSSVLPNGTLTYNADVVFFKKYLGNGNLDTSFGNGGTVLTSLINQSAINGSFIPSTSIQAQSLDLNGNIYLTGNLSTVIGDPLTNSPLPADQFFLTKYLANGTLDTSFGSNGVVITDFISTRFETANSIVIQSNGKIVVAGYAAVDGNDFNGSSFAIARYNTNGTLDTTFSDDGKIITDIRPNVNDGADVASIILQGDKIVVVGGSSVYDTTGAFAYTGTSVALVRYNSDGSIDTTFGGATKPIVMSIEPGEPDFHDDIVSEGSNVVFNISLNLATTTATTYDFSLGGPNSILTTGLAGASDIGKATFNNGVTYNATTKLITVPAGVSEFSVTVPVVQDFIAEASETLKLSIGGLEGSALIRTQQQVIHAGGGNGITDNVSPYLELNINSPEIQNRLNLSEFNQHKASILNLISGFNSKWGENIGASANLTVSFYNDSSIYATQFYNKSDAFSYEPESSLNNQQAFAAQLTWTNYESIAGLQFNQVLESSTNAGDLRYGNIEAKFGNILFDTKDDFRTAQAIPPGYNLGKTLSEDIIGAGSGDLSFVIRSSYANPTLGTYGYHAFLHELGHALGLGHPHDNQLNKPVGGEDQLKYSVLSYRAFDGASVDGYPTSVEFYPTTLMLNDILAIQFLYGANKSYRTGDDVYSWAPDQKIYETIWDAGGVDTIDASNQAQAVKIDLNSGKWSEIGVAFNNGQAEVRDCLTIAYNCTIENAIGSQFRDTLIGNEVRNVLIGGEGADTLAGAGGADILDGGIGFDTASYNINSTEVIKVDFSAGDGSFKVKSSEGVDTLTSIEFLQFKDVKYDVEAVKNGLTNLNYYSATSLIAGTNSSETQNGSAENDNFATSEGADTYVGGQGNDTYNVNGRYNGAVAKFIGNAKAASGGFSIEDNVIELKGEGEDTLAIANFGSDMSSYTTLALGAGLLKAMKNIENLDVSDTGSAKFNLTGDKGNNKLIGNDTDNIINGGVGADLMIGGLGSDTYYVDNIGDNLLDTSGAGTDTVFITTKTKNASFTLGDGIDHATLKNTVAFNLIGNELNNTLTGNGAANTLNGGLGDDTLNGGKGKDTLVGGAGNDIYYVDNAGDIISEALNEGDDIVYSTSTYTLSANIEDLTLQGKAKASGTGNDLDNTIIGNNGVNTLNGGAGNDLLDGGAGKDILIGGSGNDSLTGGLGADTFKWDLADKGVAGNPSNDFIADFKLTEKDVLDFKGLLVGESKTNIANFIDVMTENGNTEIRVSSTGGFTDGTYNSALEDAHITLLGVDLFATRSVSTDNDLLNSLINSKSLLVG